MNNYLFLCPDALPSLSLSLLRRNTLIFCDRRLSQYSSAHYLMLSCIVLQQRKSLYLTQVEMFGDCLLIGIIIAADKHEFLVKYATGGISNKIFVSKYQLYLPDQKVLEDKVKEIIDEN